MGIHGQRQSFSAWLESITMSLNKDKLFAILDKAVTMTNSYHSPYVDDDLRMLKKIGAKFLGRTANVWKTKKEDDLHFETAKIWAARVHTEVADDIVCQAAIFEAIYPEVNHISIPSWVFDDLGEKVENRNFNYNEMLGEVCVPPQGLNGGPWDGGSIPDRKSVV